MNILNRFEQLLYDDKKPRVEPFEDSMSRIIEEYKWMKEQIPLILELIRVADKTSKSNACVFRKLETVVALFLKDETLAQKQDLYFEAIKRLAIIQQRMEEQKKSKNTTEEDLKNTSADWVLAFGEMMQLGEIAARNERRTKEEHC